MKKILVVGKNGYIANCFRHYMEKFSNYEVTLITARNGAWRSIDFKAFDAVYNTTGLTHNDARAGSEKEFYTLNAELPYQLALKAKREGVPIFINMSSTIVYGNMTGIGKRMVITSETKPMPDSIYGKSKLRGEQNIRKLEDRFFQVAVIRSPLVYGATAPDNVKRLCDFALKSPIFPKLNNQLSMIYDENLCELVRLIIESGKGGIFFPQMEQYISTSEFVRDIAEAAGHRMVMTKVFNPFLSVLEGKLTFIQKAFGNQVYDKKMSEAFCGRYRVFEYKESVKRLVSVKEKDR